MRNKSLIFMGAGATASLMGTTAVLGKIIYSLKHDTFDLSSFAFSDEHKKAFISFIKILDTSNDYELKNKSDEYAKKYKSDSNKIEANLRQLRSVYDIECLRAFIDSVCDKTKEELDLMTLYTTIDLLIKEQGGLKYKKDTFFDLTRVRNARNLLNVLTHLVLMCQTDYALKYKKEVKNYQEFIDALVEITRLDSIELSNKYDFKSPDFINFNYSIVSFNWEPVFLGLIFKAHKDFNHGNNVPYLGNKCLKLRLFNDFGLTIGSLRIDEKDNSLKLWYQGHEAIAIRVNDEEYPSRLMRVGKIIYPHGSLAFRMCPVCRKTNFVVRNIDKTLNFFGPGILPEFNDFFTQNLQTDAEKEKFKEGIFDALECYSCGNIMRIVDTPLIMQTAYKGVYPPILEESLYDLTVQLKKANHLIFNGYKCSNDDIVYRSKILASLSENTNGDEKKKVSVILYNNNLQDKKWYYRKELIDKINTNSIGFESKVEIENYLKLFSDDAIKIRFSFVGFPNIITYDSSNTLDGVKDFLEFN